MSKFLDQLYGSAVGWVCVATKSEGSDAPDEMRWISWPSEKAIADRYIDIRQNEDVYVSVSVFKEKYRSSQDIAPLTRVVWADADTCGPEQFKLKPSIVVQTSPAHGDSEPCTPRDKAGLEHCFGHYHVFWVLDDVYPAKEIQEISRLVAYAHRSSGCDLGWTLSKILRVPETSNTKHTPAYHIPEATFTGEVYSPTDFYDAYGEPEEDSQGGYDLGEVPEPITPEQLVRLEDYVEESGTTDLYLNKVREDLHQSWSERMHRFQMDLFRYGCLPHEVYHLAMNAECNKYLPRNWGKATQSGEVIPDRRNFEQVTWKEVQKIWNTYNSQEVTVSQEDLVAEKEVASLELLTDEDRKKVAETPTFINQFVDWCSYRSPDHAKDYSHALAWGVLSCAYGSKAYVDSQYGRVPLNLWINVAGDSTRTRKTTVVNLALKVVEGLERQSLSTIDIGSDATAEKLITVLGARDKKVSLLTVDEVHGFYQELTSRQYRVGTKEKYTKLYDGSVPVVLRATQGSGNENKASTVFNMWGVGIYDAIVRTLTKEDFMSGFMYRTTWAISPTVPYAAGSSNFMNNQDEVSVGDETYQGIVADLYERSTRYDESDPLPMRLSDGALKRINDFADKLHTFVQQSEDTALDDGIDRLRDSVVKAAALLSFHNGHDQVEDFETLVAIEQGERWFKAFQKVFRDVSGSEFSRKCDEMEKYIAAGPGRQRSESAIYKRFAYKTTEFGEISSSLQKQGRIPHVPKQPKWEAL